MCDCITTVDAKLAERNTRLALTILFGSKPGVVPTIGTEQIERGRGKKRAVAMIPSYCPFCGEKYDREAA